MNRLVVLCVVCFFFNQICIAQAELKRPDNIALGKKGNIYIQSAWNIYEYSQRGKFVKIANDRMNDIYGEKNGKTGENYIGARIYVEGEKTGVGGRIRSEDINSFAKYFRTEPILEEVIQKVVYPTQMAVGPDENFYVVGEDVFRKSFKLGILDPNDGHPITVFPAADRGVLKTRAERLEKIINKEKFEKREELKEYVLKNKEIINDFASKAYLETILAYVPYDKFPDERKWGNFRKKIIVEWNRGEVVNPQGIAADREGNFYITDQWDNKVKVFDKQGKFVFAFGGFGEESGQFKAIKAIAVDDKNGWIYVTDNYFPTMFRGRSGEANQMRVQKFTKQGEFLLKFGDKKFKGMRLWPPGFKYEYPLDEPDGLAVDGKGNVYVLCSYSAEVKKYTHEGQLLAQWGKRGSDIGEFNDPQAIAIDKEDNVYVADTENNRVQKFDSSGKFLVEIK